MKRRISSLVLFAFALLVSLSTGCVTPEAPSSQKVTIDGTISYADGAALALQGTDVRVTIYGEGLFEGSPTCEPTDPHVPATISATVPAAASGRFLYAFDSASLSAATDLTCTLGPARLDQVERVEIEAGVPANAANCAAYCRGIGAEGTGACREDCSQGGRRLVGQVTFVGDEIQAAAPRALSDDDVTLKVALVLDSLGPTVLTGNGPDLQVDGDAAARSVRIRREYFGAGDCPIVEACVREPGSRRVLRFDGVIRNMGDQDFALGNPRGNPLFHYSSCHGHYHLTEAMKYELLDAATLEPVTLEGEPVVGHKQGFCMLDMIQVAGGNSPKFTCSNQGLTSGWADVYDSSLDCQLIDITGVAAGDYVLKVTVNPGGTLSEANKSNNSAFVPVNISAE